MVLWFGPSTFQNLAIHVSTVRCQYEESSCRASVQTSPRNLESFSVHQIVEITLFQKANQTQPLHNSTLKMKPFFSISYQNVFSAHFRGFVAFVVLWFGLTSFKIWPSTYRSYQEYIRTRVGNSRSFCYECCHGRIRSSSSLPTSVCTKKGKTFILERCARRWTLYFEEHVHAKCSPS